MPMTARITRRTLLAAPAIALASAPVSPVVAVDLAASDLVPFRRSDFGTVGVFDIDWLGTTKFRDLLDELAASPGAFAGVRFFGAFTAGRPDLYTPETSGTVWTDPAGPIDFSATFAALEQLITRGLTPFISLGFFPPAISPSPIQPPATWDRWQELVRAFLIALATDPRFGANAIANWWFEVWNEPNEGRFWQGTREQYFELYGATSEAVAETGLSIRLGGPAIAYKPQESPTDGAPWIESFLGHVAAHDIRLDFISVHRKGTVGDDPPDPRRLHEAATETGRLAGEIIPERLSGLMVINDEADEKVGFEVPYAPRMDHRNAAWLSASTVLHAQVDQQFAQTGPRFMAAADNANLQLVHAPFDGRRSVVTIASTGGDELIKLPAFAAYELLRLLGDRIGTVTAGAGQLYPETDLYQLATIAESHAASLLTCYPDPNRVGQPECTIEYRLDGLPWDVVNVALFGIDHTHSNAYTAAGGSDANPYPVPDPFDLPAIRLAQEVAVLRPIARNVPITGGSYAETLTIRSYETRCLWITPSSPLTPDPPAWIEVDRRPDRSILRWEPCREPWFWSYYIYRIAQGRLAERLNQDPLRSAMWTDARPDAAEASYGVRVVSASGVASPDARS
jgi:glycosyl hydrolase family 39 (putative alpha-L-iduronidase)